MGRGEGREGLYKVVAVTLYSIGAFHVGEDKQQVRLAHHHAKIPCVFDAVPLLGRANAPAALPTSLTCFFGMNRSTFR